MWEGTGIVREMNVGLSGYLADKRFPDVAALRGRALPRIGTYAALSRDERHFAVRRFPERCTSCRDGGYHAIEMADGEVAIDTDLCDGCSLCSHVCPEGVNLRLPANFQPSQIRCPGLSSIYAERSNTGTCSIAGSVAI